MKEVTKKEFFDSFKTLNVTTGCPANSREWEVRLKSNNQLIAKSVDDLDGNEKFFIAVIYNPPFESGITDLQNEG